MPLTVLVAHHSPDLYGSDLQLLESIRALRGSGARVVVTMPVDGPLVARVRALGAEVELLDVPVLRKAFLHPRGLLALTGGMLSGLVRAFRLVRRVRPDVVYVNTIIIPVWFAAAALNRVPSLGHVHEAETAAPRAVRAVLASPLWLAAVVVVNSRSALDALSSSSVRAVRRARVVYNGVPGPSTPPEPATAGVTDGPSRVVVVARLSPRKGNDVALEAVGLLRAAGRAVEIELCGSTADGYEWFEDELRERAARPDLDGAVTLSGYLSPTWPALARADVVVVPSRTEPFGNTAVEAQLAARPLVASRTGGLVEIVTDDVDGLLVTPDDPRALADAVARVLDDGALRERLARQGRASAVARFGTARYDADVVAAVTLAAGRRRSG